AANKCDSAIDEMVEEFEAHVRAKGYECFVISGATHDGVEALKQHLWQRLQTLPAVRLYEPEPDPTPVIEGKQEFRIMVQEGGVFIIEAPWLLRILNSVNMDDYESLQYFQRVLRMSGIIDELERLGVREGDTVSIYDFEFDYVR
ncbi:MAG: Obg family GTPase CgtA, partial [Clostridia bacterium]|nr:Obg family GTPase CgtA [Clostridia bacterium]